MLRRVHLASGWETLCGNHAALAGRRALTLDELRREVGPDRRQADRRVRLVPVARERRQAA